MVSEENKGIMLGVVMKGCLWNAAKEEMMLEVDFIGRRREREKRKRSR